MGADTIAAWLGALLVAALSFTPVIMAPTREAREMAGRVALLSLPAALLAAAWSTLSSLGLTPPPGGVFLWLLWPPAVAQVGLAAWGVGLTLRWLAAYWLGWRVPHAATVVLGAGSAALMLIVR